VDKYQHLIERTKMKRIGFEFYKVLARLLCKFAHLEISWILINTYEIKYVSKAELISSKLQESELAQATEQSSIKTGKTIVGKLTIKKN
jgi:hypothetical protein